MKFSYFPGCTLKTKAHDLDKWGRESALKLGVELREIEEWQCCGAVYPQVEDEIASRLSSVRALTSTFSAAMVRISRRKTMPLNTMSRQVSKPSCGAPRS